MKKRTWVLTPDKFLTKDQIQSLLTYLSAIRTTGLKNGDPEAVKSYYMVRILLESGLRVAEFCNLRVSDLIEDKLMVRNGKGDKPRTVLLTSSSAGMIREWTSIQSKTKRPKSEASDANEPIFISPRRDKYSTRAIQKRVKIIFKIVGLPLCLSCHSLRHTYCSMLIESKVSLTTVKENMGHSSLTTTNLYSHSLGNLSELNLYSFLDPKNQSIKESLRKTNL